MDYIQLFLHLIIILVLSYMLGNTISMCLRDFKDRPFLNLILIIINAFGFLILLLTLPK